MRVVKTALGAAILGGVLLSGTAAFAANAPAGGSIQVFGTPGAAGRILITGAIGDYGKTHNIDKNGKPAVHGTYVKAILHNGTFEINAVALNAKLGKLQPAFDATTCSANLSGTARVSLFDGTGLYKGITGTLKVTATEAFVLPRFTSGKHKGQCNTSNSAQPLDIYGSIRGAGTVKFS